MVWRARHVWMQVHLRSLRRGRVRIRQARCEDRLVGLLMLAVSTLVFTYYSVWVLVLVRRWEQQLKTMRVCSGS